MNTAAGQKFNAAEALWRALELECLRRRARFPEASQEFHRQLDLIDFSTAQPPQDCVGYYCISY